MRSRNLAELRARKRQLAAEVQITVPQIRILEALLAELGDTVGTEIARDAIRDVRRYGEAAENLMDRIIRHFDDIHNREVPHEE